MLSLTREKAAKCAQVLWETDVTREARRFSLAMTNGRRDEVAERCGWFADAMRDLSQKFSRFDPEMLWSYDPSHDYEHIKRVVNNGVEIWLARREEEQQWDLAECVAEFHANRDLHVFIIAALFHGLAEFPKGTELAKRSGEASAILARHWLYAHRFDRDMSAEIVHAILVHPWSAGVKDPGTWSAQALQDADRLELGLTGVLRAFACRSVPGEYKLYCTSDPFHAARHPDARQYSLDHILGKVSALTSLEHFHFESSRQIAIDRGYVEHLAKFLELAKKDLNVKPVFEELFA